MKTQLRIFGAKQPQAPREVLSDRDAIVARLATQGITLEHWEATAPLFPDASEADVLEAYGADIFRLKIDQDYQHIDVLRVDPKAAILEDLRERAHGEHTHADDEVRFIVEGAAVYFLHFEDEVYELRCSVGDLFTVPAEVRHWFDPGEIPYLTMIRLFSAAPGWAARYTGDPLVYRFAPFAGAGDPGAA